MEAQERRQGWKYDWLVRMRTDLLILSDIPPLHLLPASYVYLPRSGMAKLEKWAFMNDQVFLCPRHHCSSYFNTAELFQRCDDGAPQPQDPEYVPGQNESPTGNGTWSLNPYPAGSHWQWWTLRRYGGSLKLGSSGIMRELTWLYAIVRSREIQCYRLEYREDPKVRLSSFT